MDQVLLFLIRQSMNDKGFHSWRDYRVKAVRVQSAPASLNVEVPAFNEFFFLVAKTVPATLKIISDADSLAPSESSVYSQFNYYQLKEFTGQISISATVPIDLEFIRVIPRIKKTTERK
jgi:hypothetical protein